MYLFLFIPAIIKKLKWTLFCLIRINFFYLLLVRSVSFAINIAMIARIDEFNLFMLNYVTV